MATTELDSNPSRRRSRADGRTIHARISRRATDGSDPTRSFRPADAADLLGAAAGSFCLDVADLRAAHAAVGRRSVSSSSWYALFLVTTWFLARERVGELHARDRLASVVVAHGRDRDVDSARPDRRLHDRPRLPRAAAAVLHAGSEPVGPAEPGDRRRRLGARSSATLEMVAIASLICRSARHLDRGVPQRGRRTLSPRGRSA